MPVEYEHYYTLPPLRAQGAFLEGPLTNEDARSLIITRRCFLANMQQFYEILEDFDFTALAAGDNSLKHAALNMLGFDAQGLTWGDMNFIPRLQWWIHSLYPHPEVIGAQISNELMVEFLLGVQTTDAGFWLVMRHLTRLHNHVMDTEFPPICVQIYFAYDPLKPLQNH